MRISGTSSRDDAAIAPPRLFRALADRTRLRIVNLLADGPLCVCDIRRILGLPQSSVSRHLALLKSAGLLGDRRDGMRVFYALTDWETPLARAVLAAIRSQLAVRGDYLRDARTLAALRASGACHVEPKAWSRASARKARHHARAEA